MEKKIEITISENNFPKLFKLDDNCLKNKINYLLNIGYQNVYSSIEEKKIVSSVENICRKYKDDIINGIYQKNLLIDNNITLLKNDILKLDVNEEVEKLNNVMNKMFGISTTSNKKGQISEELIYRIIQDKYPNYSYEVKRHIAHHADGELISPNGMKCLVEIKNYTHVVNKEEITKFKNDLKTTNNNLGIFISLQTNISSKKLIDYETYGDTHIIYISKIMEDINKLDCGILLLENIYKLIKQDNIELKVNQIKDAIFHNFEELEKLIIKTNKIKDKYNLMEKSIKENLDRFYIDLREYELELKTKMQTVWKSLFNDLKDIEKNYIDQTDKIIKKINKKDKCFNILNKLFDFFSKNKINVIEENNIYKLIKNKDEIAIIKKMKTKIQVNFQKINMSITLDPKDRSCNESLTILQNLIK